MTFARARAALLALAPMVLAGCGSFSVWPFGESGPAERSARPVDAAEYRCEGGKGFFIRPLEDGAVWLIAPDREIRLARIGGAQSARYGVARVVLEISGDTATLVDPPATFSGCTLFKPASS